MDIDPGFTVTEENGNVPTVMPQALQHAVLHAAGHDEAKTLLRSRLNQKNSIA
ncbi:hypothetical protein [Oleiagrimonas sp.]|jgi:hypothetical protein|uniref:hypothetical protein n=1 Tax=Oleiagrimonas sp. TaxID=2010330 RepID=UPI002613AA09|nr:hypothetical protein [Oleiagrimonas sp.]MDA3912563.1 hypothetical protein [Oleiagrimonas sp.]